MAAKPEMIPRDRIAQVALFMADYGNFLAVWSTFDLVIEILIMRKLGIDEEANSIVCAGLGFGAKVAILCSLLNRTEGNGESVAMIKKAQTLAERNSFAHGFFLIDREKAHFKLVKREVKDRYEVKIKELNYTLMVKHSTVFVTHMAAVQRHFSVVDDDLAEYTKRIEARALA